MRRSTRILVLNPNSSKSMTHGVEEAIRGIKISDVRSDAELVVFYLIP